MRKIFIVIGIILILATIFFVYKQKTKYRDESMDRWEAGKIVVGFKKGVDFEAIKRIILKYNLKISEEQPNINVPEMMYIEAGEIYNIEVPIGKEKRFLKKLQKEPEIIWTFHFYSFQKVIFD